MPEFTKLWEGGPEFCQAEHFRLSTDCVLLADFIKTAGARRGIDLGCASGAIALLLLEKSPALSMTGIEIVPEAAELAVMNMDRNGLAERAEIVCGDIRAHRELFRAGSFDLAAANPPYFPVGSGYISPDAKRAAARGELSCTLDDICAAAAFLLRTGGSFCLVHKPERLSEALCTMTAHAIEPKRLRLVQTHAEAAPNLVLIEGRRGGRPGLTVEAPLLLRGADGGESPEILKIYHRENIG